jgi:phosphoribosylformimino-5-aminoimidazole carboxamide ribotide isomerase
MIIPSIDLQSGRAVQLVQGERLALERDLDAMLAAFAGFPCLQVIDLDAAKGAGANDDMVRRCCAAGFAVRVGGGIRSRARAEQALGWGAAQVIAGSAAFTGEGLNLGFLESLASLGRGRVILAVDARQGQVAVDGWRRTLPLTPVEAIRQAEAHCGGFLYTHIDGEGLQKGTSLAAAAALRAATSLPLAIAGGIASLAEIDVLDAMRCDAVLGMALYTGKLGLEALHARAAGGSTARSRRR